MSPPKVFGFRSALASLVPNWRNRRPGKENGFRFVWSMLLPLDIMLEWLLQGMNAAGPGSPGNTPTALPLTGQARGIIRGEAETDAEYSARLRNWIGPAPFTGEIWANAGKSEQLAQEIQTYLANNPVVRVIERIWSDGGTPMATWITANADGTTSRQVAAWDWDSQGGWTDPRETYSGDVTRGFWSDFWIVVYPCEWAVTGSTLSSLVGVWGTSTGGGTGHAVPRAAVDNILRLLRQFKGAHAFCRAIIWSYDGTKFTPSSPTADGWYGNWTKPNGSGSTTTARDASARYWIPSQGG